MEKIGYCLKQLDHAQTHKKKSQTKIKVSNDHWHGETCALWVLWFSCGVLSFFLHIWRKSILHHIYTWVLMIFRWRIVLWCLMVLSLVIFSFWYCMLKVCQLCFSTYSYDPTCMCIPSLFKRHYLWDCAPNSILQGFS